MTSKRILVVEDEGAIREMVAFGLSRAGYEVDEAEDCRADRMPDLILLDWMLPDISGLEFARSLRRDEMTREIPIIMLTARTQEDDKVRGLDGGVDDYMTKPFSSRELLARIKAVMRRSAPEGDSDEVAANGLVMNLASHRISADGEPIELGPTEFRMLKFFMTHQDRVYTRSQLLDHIWGGNVFVEERTVDVHILRLRKALARRGYDRLIQTVRGAGYRFSTLESD